VKTPAASSDLQSKRRAFRSFMDSSIQRFLGFLGFAFVRAARFGFSAFFAGTAWSRSSSRTKSRNTNGASAPTERMRGVIC
jgi:hypothetical protein